MTISNNIHTWLKELGHKIAEHAEPLKGMGGDHDYDGVINIVWQGIHEALGIQKSNCEPHMAYDCELAKNNEFAYTGPSQEGGPLPIKSRSESFVDGYTWARVIDQVYDLNSMPNKTQENILNVVLDRAEQDHELMQAILDAYRNTSDLGAETSDD